jgi:uncharacterized protein YyaL (SSP411 family)
LAACAALARAGHVLDRDDWIVAARQSADIVLARSFEAGRGVRHVVEPNPEEFRFLETQAEAAFALADLHESTGERRYLEAARSIAEFSLLNLGASGEVALRDRLPEAAPIGLLASPRWPVRANATFARALVRLAIHGSDPAMRERAVRIAGAIGGGVDKLGVQGIEVGLAIEAVLREPVRVRVDGSSDDPRTGALRRAALRSTHPWIVVTRGADSGEPAAVVEAGGAEARVTHADDLDPAIVRLVGPVPGA